jgi:hypothetical protein
VQVGNLDDFMCYERAELIPSANIYLNSQEKAKGPLCGAQTRTTIIANATHNAAEVAGVVSSALAAAASLLQEDDPQCAFVCMHVVNCGS